MAGPGISARTSIRPDTRPRAHLLPHGEGLRLEIFVKPLGKGGPYLKPGAGAGHLMADVEGLRCQAERARQEDNQRVITSYSIHYTKLYD